MSQTGIKLTKIRKPGVDIFIAIRGGEEVGHLKLYAYNGQPYVKFVRTDSARREGIATKLYMKAAVSACRDYGQPLESDVERSLYSHQFWVKQVTKGRAHCVQEVRPRHPANPAAMANGRGGCLRYRMNDCEIRDLRGPQPRRHR